MGRKMIPETSVIGIMGSNSACVIDMLEIIYDIVACRPIARQRQRNKLLDIGRY
jgi:hypothetical protein